MKEILVFAHGLKSRQFDYVNVCKRYGIKSFDDLMRKPFWKTPEGMSLYGKPLTAAFHAWEWLNKPSERRNYLKLVAEIQRGKEKLLQPPEGANPVAKLVASRRVSRMVGEGSTPFMKGCLQEDWGRNVLGFLAP